MIYHRCNQTTDEKTCAKSTFSAYKCTWNGYESIYVPGSKPCHVAFADKEDLITANNQNVGTDCLDGTRCYYGCGGKGMFRSTLNYSIMQFESAPDSEFNEISKKNLCKQIPTSHGYCDKYDQPHSVQ